MKTDELRVFFMSELPELSDSVENGSLEEMAEATKSYRGMSAVKATLRMSISGTAENRKTVEHLAQTQGGIFSEGATNDGRTFGMVYVIRPANLNRKPSFWFEKANDSVESIVFLLDDEQRHVCFVERPAATPEAETGE